MNYPGDPQLSPDVQNRILATFEQTLALAEQGNRQEALLGCDFVLRMDPQFSPARLLVERLENGNGAPKVADLRAGLSAAQAAGGDLFDLSTLGDELPELEDEVSLGEPAGDDLRTRLELLFGARHFEELVALAEREAGAVIADPRLGALAEAARDRMEAAPYVARFVGKARQTLEAGDAAEAARLLEKARSLDETHPDVVALERSIMTSSRTAAPAAAPAAPALAEPELPAALRPTVSDDLLGGGQGDAESERRIAQLLAEGQSALDGGDPQAAIDSWSRIFLIDIDHQEAARRIELARKLKAENERQVEEVFHDGVASLEAGDLAAARGAFARVLELQPGYLAAREYIEQIDAGTVPAVRPRPAGPAPAAAARPAPGAGEPVLPATDLPDLTDVELKEEILVPPEPGEMPERGAERRPGAAAAAAREGRFNRKFLYIGGAVLALVLAAAAYVLLNWDTFFPNSNSDELAAPAPAPDPIEQALALHRGGDTPAALAKLRQVPPVHPKHARAQALIAEWTRPAAPAVPAAPPPLAPDVDARRQAALAAARQAYQGNANLLAVQRFEEAAALARLEPGDADQLSRAKTRLEPLAQQIALFKDREWEYVVPALWRLREDSPGPDVDRLLIDSYYNLGVRDLQQFNPEEAVKHFEEALKLAPGDEVVRRQYTFADTYRERPQDLLFRIYVKYLTFR